MNRYIKGSLKALLFATFAWSGASDAASRYDNLKHIDIRDLEKYGGDIQTVYKVQKALWDLGYDIGVDGLKGPQTERLVGEYQSSRGLQVTRSMDDATLQSLGLQRVLGLEDVAERLGDSLEENTALYTGVADTVTNTITPANNYVRYYAAGAEGPKAVGPNAGSVRKDASGNSYFSINEDPAHTRMNTIFSAEIEDIIEEVEGQVFKLQVILFIHDDTSAVADGSFGFYFRRLQVQVDLADTNESTKGVQILRHVQDIPLVQTNFHVLGDILDRKVILEDNTNNIIKIFPIGVGGFDIQTATGMDGSAVSTTFEFPNAKMKSTQAQSTWSNTRSRTSPSYYKGRPFLALYAGGTNYRSIGLHYQIDDDGLTRGFVSHGCVRVRDKDLYQLDAILNDGPHQAIDTHIVYDLKGYEHLDHPMPKKNHEYSLKVFSTVTTADRISHEQCGSTTHNVQWVGGGYHTVADSDCLSKHVSRKGDVQEVIDYIRGKGLIVPQSAIDPTMQHHWYQGQVYLDGQYVDPSAVYTQGQYGGYENTGGGFWGNQNYTPPQSIPTCDAYARSQLQEAEANVRAYTNHVNSLVNTYNEMNRRYSSGCKVLFKPGWCSSLQYEMQSVRARYDQDNAYLQRWESIRRQYAGC